jgi:heme-degrading monooxygenase HmoA
MLLRNPSIRAGEGGVVTIGMNYFVRDGKEEVFEAACAKVIDLMADIGGHDESHIYRRVAQGSPVYLVVSRWENEDAFSNFVASDAFKKVTDWGKLNILNGRPTHTTYHE